VAAEAPASGVRPSSVDGAGFVAAPLAPAIRGDGHVPAAAALAPALAADPASPGPPATSSPAEVAPAIVPPATISAYEPSWWERAKDIFTAGIPRYSSRTVNDPKFGSMQLVTPEAAMTPGEQARHPIATGIGELAGGLTSPESVALIAGTWGIGPLSAQAAKTAPFLLRAAPRALSAFFTEEMLRGAYNEFPKFKEAMDRGDESEALRLFTHLVGSGALAYLAGHHAATGETLPLARARPAPSSEPERAERPVAAPIEESRAVPGGPGPRAWEVVDERAGTSIQPASAARAWDVASEGQARPAAGDVFDVMTERTAARGAATPGSSAAGATAAAGSAARPLYEMSVDELDAAHKAAKADERAAAVEVFGEEGARRYERLQRAANSSDVDRADAASDEIREMERGLTREQEARLFGEGQAAPGAEEIGEFRRALGQLDWESPKDLGRSLRWAITRMGELRDPEAMTLDQRLSYAQLREGLRGAAERGWDSREVLDEALRGAAARFGPEAEFMLQPMIDAAARAREGQPAAAAGREGEAPALPAGRGEAAMYSGIDPRAMAEGARILSRAWEDKVARPFADRVLRIGDKYVKAKEADPEVAEGLHLLDNAPTYLRAKALQEVRNVVGDLTRPQERLFTLMADADARENLRLNHPEEYRGAEDDPAVQAALGRYRPLEREVTRLREKLGGATLDQDYLRRVYEEHVAGVNKPEAPGDTERATSAFDRVIRPQKTDRFSREAEAEYHYEHGLHELGPAFATKFIATHLKALRDQVAHDFLDKATKLPLGAPEPRSIEYNGATYYSPEIARDMREAGRKNVLEYGRYDPTAGEKFPTPTDGKFLGPRELTKVLTDFARRDESEPGGLRRFFQEQVIGFGFGIPHVFNILRRVSQGVPGGQANPEGWVRAWRVAFDKGLRERGLAGLNDPGFDMLARRGAISTGEAANLKRYIGGNLNPANWARVVAKVGHKLLFEPGSAGGFGGFDQRARLYVADLVRSQRPDLSDSEIAAAVRTQLGDYNRANWTDRQKMLGRFMMWPGWDFASLRWVLQHPIRTTVPPALLVLLANKALGTFGANREEDRDDIGVVHIGDRDYSPSLLRESTARNLFRPVLAYAQSRMRGESNARAMDAAARGVTAGAGGLLNMLRPDLSGFLALAANRHQLVTGREIVGRDDYDAPGQILPSRALEKQAEFTVRHALPALDRMLDSGDQDIDLRSFVGGNLGLPNYRDDAEKRLLRNAAESERVFESVSQLAKTKPEAARGMLQDADNAVYALFHRDLAQMASVLHRVDQAKEAVSDSKLSKEEKEQRLAEIEDARRNLLEHADGLNSLLFRRREQARTVAAPISKPAARQEQLAPPIQ